MTWLYLMMELTPAYRIKLISVKQGLVGRRGGRDGKRENNNRGAGRKVQQEDGTIKNGPLGGWWWAGYWGWWRVWEGCWLVFSRGNTVGQRDKGLKRLLGVLWGQMVP